MIVFGYAKGYQYAGDGTLHIQVRIPSIHGPYKQSGYSGQPVRNYKQDSELPFYQSILLPHLPSEGEVVVLSSMNTSMNNLIVIGLTGGSYYSGVTNLEG